MPETRWEREQVWEGRSKGGDLSTYHAGVGVMDLVVEADEILIPHRGSAGGRKGRRATQYMNLKHRDAKKVQKG